MARLIVEARTAEFLWGHSQYFLYLGISVSRADDGRPVTGLRAGNFRVASLKRSLGRLHVAGAYDTRWAPTNVELSGCYLLEITMTPPTDFERGTQWIFGVQARTILPLIEDRGRFIIEDHGQTIIELTSAGAGI